MISIVNLPNLLEYRRLFLRNYEIYTRIGIHEYEKFESQRVLINIELYIPMKFSTPYSDLLSEVVNYHFMREVVERRIAQGHISLQETLCDDLATSILNHPKIEAVRISTEKPDAYSDCESVGVEIFRRKKKMHVYHHFLGWIKNRCNNKS